VKEYVLDANALIHFFRRTPGFLQVRGLIQQAKEGRAHLAISVVNLGEVFYVLAHYFGVEEARRCILETQKSVTTISISDEMALDAALLRYQYKLGYADCFAAELAMRTGATLVTADADFAKLGKRLKVLALPRHTA
jgi:predicted nucleic acid-binding protein